MQTTKPLPHLTIRSGPWAGTMVRFATMAQLRAVQRRARSVGHDTTSDDVLAYAFEHTIAQVLNAPQPKESK